jgi:DNA polymerase
VTTLREIVDGWRDCHACDLSSKRHSVVVFSPWHKDPTDTDPLILVVGEAPGRQEDRTGQAFVGESGQILRRDILVPGGVRLAAITNVAGCWPGQGNPDPTVQQIEACAPRLDALVEAMQPDGLLTVGRISARVRSFPWRRYFDDRPTASITHPAALLRKGHPNAATTKVLRTQVAKVRNLLKKLGVRPPDDTATDNCDHDFVTAGVWVARDGARTPFNACTKCGLVEG